MDNIEKYIQNQFNKIDNSGSDMVERVEKMIQSEQSASKRVNIVRYVRRVAVAAVFCIVCICASVNIYAGIKGISVEDIFMGIWNSEYTNIDETISCDAKLLSEESTFSNIDIEPYKVIGDYNGIYIVFKVVADNLSMDTLFEDCQVEYEGCQNASLDMYPIECTDNVMYIAVEYIGTCGKSVSDSETVDVTLANIGSYEGVYKASIEYCYSGKTRDMKVLDYTFNISNLSITCEAENEDDYMKLLSFVISLKMKNGDIITTNQIYGVEQDDSYIVTYTIDVPINIDDVSDVVVESDIWEVQDEE